MRPELHPDAARNLNDKARALLDKVAPMTEALPSEMPTHIARPGAPAHVVSEGELFDFKITGLQDQLGRTTARYFEHQGRRFGLEGELQLAVAVVRPEPGAWAYALHLAGGNVRRLRVLSDGSVVVRNAR